MKHLQQIHVSKDSDGFTFVEIMIVVAILGILAAIAIPAYQGYISVSKRNSAEAVLEQFPILLETFRAETGSFPANGTYTYVEAADGTITSQTIMTGAGLTDFSPRSKTTTVGAISFNYSITIAASGTAAENATYTATGVRDSAGVNAAGAYQ